MRNKYFKYLFLIVFSISVMPIYSAQIIDTSCFLSMVPYEGETDNVRYIKLEESRPVIHEGRTIIKENYRIVCWINQFPIIKGEKIGILAQPSMGLVGIKKLVIRIAGAEIKSFDYSPVITDDFKSMYFIKFDTSKLKSGIEYMIEAAFETDNGKRRAASQLFFQLVDRLQDPQAEDVARRIASATSRLSEDIKKLQEKYDRDQAIYSENLKKYDNELAEARAEAKKQPQSENKIIYQDRVVDKVVVDNAKVNQLTSENNNLKNRLAQLERDLNESRNQKQTVPSNSWTGVFSVKGTGVAMVKYDWNDGNPSTRSIDIKNYMVCSNVMLPCTLTVTLNGVTKTHTIENKDRMNYFCFDFTQ